MQYTRKRWRGILPDPKLILSSSFFIVRYSKAKHFSSSISRLCSLKEYELSFSFIFQASTSSWQSILKHLYFSLPWPNTPTSFRVVSSCCQLPSKLDLIFFFSLVICADLPPIPQPGAFLGTITLSMAQLQHQEQGWEENN